MKSDISFVKKYRDRLQAYVKLSSAIGEHVYNVQGGGGNTSVKLDDELMAIKASGYKLSDVEPAKGYAVMSYQPLRAFYLEHKATDFSDVEASGAAEAKAATVEVDGLDIVRPSVEAGFHAILERYVAHSHSVFANLAACTQNSAEVLDVAFAGADYQWGLVPYTDPGARLAFAINEERQRVQKMHGVIPKVIIMQNHGLIVSADDVDECLSIHADANQRLAAYFDVAVDAFPEVSIAVTADGFQSATPFLKKHLAGDKYDESFFNTTLLYPDQQVFLQDTLVFGDVAEDGKATVHPDGSVSYRMTQNKAQVIEETLTSVIFIVETIARKGLKLSVMGEEAQAFIGSWESEKYRQQISEQST